MPRTVYVLGAGFSYPGGVPVQNRLLQRVRELGIMQAPVEVVSEFLEAQAVSLKFIDRIRRWSAVAPPLEDAFTLLDQTISSRGYCLGYTWQDLVLVRERLQQVLLFVLHSACREIRNPDFYRDVAQYLLSRAVGNSGNAVDVISLNWDSVLDDAAFAVISKLKGTDALDLDFGCDTHPLLPESGHSPSVTQAARGVQSLNVFKLHGSINWLNCPSCNELFSGAGSDVSPWTTYFGGTCPFCIAGLLESGAPKRVPLRPILVTPTFLKVLDNVHVESTWQRAFRALSLADEIVFLGYSLPLADFHVRALLRRALRPEVRATAVLLPADKSEPGGAAPSGEQFAATRFEEFFGDALTVDSRGVEGYFGEAFKGTSPEQAAETLEACIAAREPHPETGGATAPA